jgi:hypothetical protein
MKLTKMKMMHETPINNKTVNSDLGAVSGSLSHDIYLFKVKDYTTILLGRYHDGKFYIQRGDGVKYEYEAYRVVWKRLLNCH